MIGNLQSILAISTALLLTACVSDDPRQGGFFGGLAGLGSGTYEQRVADEEAALKLEKVRHQEEVDDGAKLDNVIGNRESQALDMEREILLLREDIDSLDTEIEVLLHERIIAQDDVVRAEADVAALLDEIERIEAEQVTNEQARALGADAGSDTDPAAFGEPSREEVSELRAYINKLQEAVDALKATRARQAAEATTEPAVDVAD